MATNLKETSTNLLGMDDFEEIKQEEVIEARNFTANSNINKK